MFDRKSNLRQPFLLALTFCLLAAVGCQHAEVHSRLAANSSRCGRTFDDTLRMFRRYYGEQRPLPFLMIETWNDYEEGTAIENGVASCK
jgi:hypothetical protein